ncbi:CRISPR-associated endonuclease Cas1 [Chromatium okenii]|uniref:CRISPR-associated endonuclease Cas1 n=1 Tax=Chromatium okenii TaxID=61644 RepID=UPI003083F2B4
MLESSSFKRDVLVMEQPSGACHRIGLKAIKQLLIKSDIYLSSTLLDACLAAGVSVVILPGRAREPARHLFPETNGALRLRLAQYAAYLDPQQRLEIAQQFIIGKITAQADCLRRHGIDLPSERFIRHVRASTDIASLMGIEGASTARYFHRWAVLLNPGWEFTGRNRRPPRDPINALLSLSYTLASHAVGRLAAQAGFETALGFLHSPSAGRASLALDVVEPLRPWIDDWVLTFCNDSGITPDSFVTDPKTGCRLTKPAFGQFFQRWYTSAEHGLEHQTRAQLELLRTKLGCEPNWSLPPADAA